MDVLDVVMPNLVKYLSVKDIGVMVLVNSTIINVMSKTQVLYAISTYHWLPYRLSLSKLFIVYRLPISHQLRLAIRNDDVRLVTAVLAPATERGPINHLTSPSNMITNGISYAISNNNQSMVQLLLQIYLSTDHQICNDSIDESDDWEFYEHDDPHMHIIRYQILIYGCKSVWTILICL